MSRSVVSPSAVAAVLAATIRGSALSADSPSPRTMAVMAIRMPPVFCRLSRTANANPAV